MARLMVLGFALLLAGCGDDAATGGSGAGTDGGGGDGAADGGGPSGGNGGDGGTAGNGGTGGEGAEDFGSGSRLRARHYDANPTARVFASFVDTENDDVDCAPGRATDGQLRCIPFSRTAVNYYADATCDVPVLVIEEGCPAPKSMLEISDEESADICSFSNDRASFGRPPQEVHRIGAATTPTELYLYNGVTCDLFDLGLLGEGFLFYPSTGVVAPSELAAFEVTVEARDGGLAAEIISSEDGAWVLGSARNAETDELCANDDGICFPPHIASDQNGTYHTLADCSDPPKVAHNSRGCEPPPSPTIAVAGYQTDPLPYELGDEVTAAQIYRFAFGSCDPISDTEAGDYTVYDLGAALDEADYPTYERVERGESRVKIFAFESPDGALLYPPASFVDTGLGGQCQLARASDGKLHCISNASVTHNGDYFTDAGCTMPFFMVAIGDDSHFAEVTPGCDNELAIGDDVYEFVDYSGAIYSSIAGNCVAAGTSAGSALGENVGPDVFPIILEVVD